jgi:hypothetical protein
VPDLTPAVLAWLQSHHGVAHRTQLRQLGVARRRLERLLSDGVLEPVAPFRSVLRLAGSAVTLAQRCVALCLAHPRGYVTGTTAGRLLELRRMPRSHTLQLAVPHPCHLPAVPGVRFRQTTRIDPGDVVHRPDGITIASPARLAFDLAADLGRLDHLSVVEALLHHQLTDVDTLVRTAQRLAHPRRPGSLRFVRTLSLRGDTPAVESHPELLVAEALRARGVPVQVQVTWLKLPNGRSIRVDVSVPEVRWGLEIDVHPHHLGLSGSTADKRRDRQCHLIGWQVDRVTELDLLDLPGLIDELVAIYEIRRATITAA